MNGVAVRILVSESSQVGEARRIAQKMAVRIGCDDTKAGQVAIAVSEAANNLLKHAGKGEMVLRAVDHHGIAALDVLALDKGPGISNMPRAMRDGYSTGATAGIGLGAIMRLSDRFEIYSQPGKGTALIARFSCEPPSGSARFEVEGLSVAVTGEQLCGDGWSYAETERGAVVFVADGLGHGLQAEAAAREAIGAFQKSGSQAPVEILDAVHRATGGTRGAAVAVASIDTHDRVVRFAGVGNISGVIFSEPEATHMVSMSGTIGHEARTFREFKYPWRDDSLLILHSDGVGTRWDLSAYPGLAHKSCGLIAGVLYRDMARPRDDSTVVVGRQRTPE